MEEEEFSNKLNHNRLVKAYQRLEAQRLKEEKQPYVVHEVTVRRGRPKKQAHQDQLRLF